MVSAVVTGLLCRAEDRSGVDRATSSFWHHGGVDESCAGRLVVASPLLLDPNFLRTVVLILQHDAEGALGLVLNRPSSEGLVRHVPGWSEAVSEPQVVFVGGPVEPEIAVGLVGGEGVEPTAVAGLAIGDLHLTPPPGVAARVFSGYSGWSAGQLEAELAEGAWVLVDARSGDAFSAHPERLWAEVLRRQGGSLALLSSYPVDPRLN